MGEMNGSGPLLSKLQILDAVDLARERVSVPEWGGDVMVRALTGIEREEFDGTISSIRQTIGGKKGNEIEFHANRVRIALVSRTMIDESGARMFVNELDVQRLGAKSAQALERVYVVAARLSGLTADSVDEAVKTSGDSQADASSLH